VFKKQKEPIISFISMVDGLSSIPDAQPRPAKHFVPDWWKNLAVERPTQDFQKHNAGNVRNCPSFPDYFSQGFILPMWTDTLLKYDNEYSFQWEVAGSQFGWSTHANNQFLNHANPTVEGKQGQFIFKALCPWRVVTKPGYSVLQLPLFYNFNEDFTVLPGIIDTDIHHEINQQVLIFSSNKLITINRGDPFVAYIPFKREKHSFDVRDATAEDRSVQNNLDLIMATKFPGAKQYSQKRKIKDKNYE